MSYYINCIKRSGNLSRDIKELIPNMNIRRRMSSVVKAGVSTALDSLADFEEAGGKVDAIITSTWLGCIADSEKFLANIISEDEQMLNPTPFIQSTFNTVGGQIALIKGLRCYNNTFSHRFTSFESALLDATLQLDLGGVSAVLVGVFDEVTPSVEAILDRLRLTPQTSRGEGALFFVLTKERLDSSVAELLDINLYPTTRAKSATSISGQEWSGTIAEAITSGKSGRFDSDIYGGFHSQIEVRWL